MDFNDILNQSTEEINEPGILPMGTWRFQIVSGKMRENKNEGGPKAEAFFTVTPLEPSDDVSEVELEAFADELEGARTYHKIAIWQKNDMWNVVRFLKTLGYDLEEGDKLGESITKVKGHEFMAFVKHAENSNDPERPFVNLENIQAVE